MRPPSIPKAWPRPVDFRYHVLRRVVRTHPPGCALGADRWQIPVVLVRSHNKLDSLGVEYGRLGSVAFVTTERLAYGRKRKCLHDLHMRNQKRRSTVRRRRAARAFPALVGTTVMIGFLTSKRIAAILRNSRRTARYFASELAGATAELNFAHGLYVTLASDRTLDEQEARQIAAALSGDLSKAGLPVRHAGASGLISPQQNGSKAEEAGRIWIEVDPRHTSDRCENCGHAAAENRVTQAEFACQACGHGPTQADEHAARNILRAGLALHAQAV